MLLQSKTLSLLTRALITSNNREIRPLSLRCRNLLKNRLVCRSHVIHCTYPLPSFLPFFLSSFFPPFLPFFLPSFLPSFQRIVLFQKTNVVKNINLLLTLCWSVALFLAVPNNLFFYLPSFPSHLNPPPTHTPGS